MLRTIVTQHSDGRVAGCKPASGIESRHENSNAVLSAEALEFSRLLSI